MKAVLSNRIYLEVDDTLAETIKGELTYQIPSYADPDNPIIIRTYSTFRKGIMTLPIGRMDLIPPDYEIVDKRVLNPVEFPPFGGTLRESQQLVHDELDDNCIINAKVSWGKTFTAMAIARKLGQKTLIVVHTIPLMNQWAKEVRKVYGFEPGLIGNGHDRTDAPITIGNVQSLYTRMDRLCKEFGTIIMDEMHHVSSPTFSKIVDRSYARYKIGLSGTIERKDGKHVVFRDYFGMKIFKPAKENYMKPEVDVLDTGIYFPDGKEMGWAAKVTMLQESISYRMLIAAAAAKYASEGHKVLVVSDRVEFLQDMASRTKGALIIGSTKDRDGELAKLDNDQTDILNATQSIFSEGISHDPLSVVIMATPINNMPLLEQLIGRVERLCPGKLTPRVVDVKLRGNTVERQFLNRVGHYIKQGYIINYI